MAQNPQVPYKIDQARTFLSVLCLELNPKTAFGDQYRQETTKDGIPKWEAELAVKFETFGRPTNALIKVGMVSEKDPREGLDLPTMVELVDFEVGVMDATDRDGKPRGAQVWYRCTEIRPLTATGPRSRPVKGGDEQAGAA